MSTKDRILHESHQLFKRLGIRSVSMDDIANHLGISKKTIYQHFADKKSLVRKVFKHDLEMDQRVCTESCSQNHNAVEQFVNISRFINHNLKDINPAVLNDLQKYYPECWEEFDGYSKEFIHGYIEQNVKLGIAQGYYRDNLQAELVADIYIGMVKGMMFPNSDSANKLSLPETHNQLITYHLHGISTPKGIQYLNQINDHE